MLIYSINNYQHYFTVLRLDNAPESYGDSFVDLSYNNPTTANATTAQNSNTPPYDAIPMDNMTLSPHIP